MATGSLFTILEKSQPRGHSVLCFNAKLRITFIGKGSDKICLDLCEGPVAESDALPAKLQEIVRKSGNRNTEQQQTSVEPLILPLKDGPPVRLRVVHDPDETNHCLIFEREPAVSSPEQLKPLGLSSRETEISFWISQNKTNWEISKILQISARTVEKHLENIFRKLNIDNREMLVERVRETCAGD